PLSLSTHTSPPALSPLSLHDALPIFRLRRARRGRRGARRGRVGRDARALAGGRGGGEGAGAWRDRAPDGGVRRAVPRRPAPGPRSEEHTSELQSLAYPVCRLRLEKKKWRNTRRRSPNSPASACPPSPAPARPHPRQRARTSAV